ncbi:hypothetical protein KZ483_27645 [Paenibacillus sp. sptzw28]|uniref:hypothetical protein n=1 Tax=Paenibacillus sp. sptzw28 TaxID=715179 RepID=UPI001C6EC673|nr:hypothetical protein [Paenibacillus sp. sptzw28]QYR21399.1 hypothetical protein KZ483_27645 [Paenibacillus sp. sptzw28]
MMGMHPYQFEQFHQAQQAEQRHRHKHTWLLADFKKRSLEVSRFSVHFRSKRDDELQLKAYLVLEEMLQHENEALRLQAAEIVLHRSGRTGLRRVFGRS